MDSNCIDLRVVHSCSSRVFLRGEGVFFYHSYAQSNASPRPILQRKKTYYTKVIIILLPINYNRNELYIVWSIVLARKVKADIMRYLVSNFFDTSITFLFIVSLLFIIVRTVVVWTTVGAWVSMWDRVIRWWQRRQRRQQWKYKKNILKTLGIHNRTTTRSE